MPTINTPLHLPNYHLFIESIAGLALPISGSELHGVMCGYLCAGAVSEGEAYLRALMINTNKKDPSIRTATLALFGVFAVSHQQMTSFDFAFQLLLPDNEDPITERAQAFSEWCDGFTQGITMAGINHDQLHEEEAQEALQHLTEFGELDYLSLDRDEGDEKALMEVSEYARMAVLHIYSDLQANKSGGQSQLAH